MQLSQSHRKLLLAMALLVILSLLLTPFASSFHDHEHCEHEYCPFCIFLNHGSAGQSSAGFWLFICLLFALYGIIPYDKSGKPICTPVHLKVRINR